MTNALIDRVFTIDDAILIERLIGGVAGARCVAWRRSYGRSGSLHFGSLVRRSHAPGRAVYRDQGEWIVGLWDCDRRLTMPGYGVFDNRVHGDDSILRQLLQLVHKSVESVTFDVSSLDLVLTFDDGTRIELDVDPSSDSTSEQWAVQRPDGETIVMYGGRRWVLERRGSVASNDESGEGMQ